jgi:homoserine O-acetyltransferase
MQVKSEFPYNLFRINNFSISGKGFGIIPKVNTMDFSKNNEISRRNFLQTATAAAGILLTSGAAVAVENLAVSDENKPVEAKKLIVKKQKFSVKSFHFEDADVSIPVEIGYETWGKLSPNKDNAVMICHFFTGTSHAAGRYAESDETPGWWDNLIGPGKAIDTDKYFVICTDSISNINARNPMVITTGPASINPATGRHYGAGFPIFTLKDVVKLQRQLVESLGIKKLQAILGPSMGGLQSFMWARHFGDMSGKIVSVAATPLIEAYGIMIPNQLGIEAIRLDPDWDNGDYYGKTIPERGLLLAFKILLMATRTEDWAERNFSRQYADPAFINSPNPFKSFSGKYKVEKEIENIVLGRMKFFDPNSYMYIAKANTLYDLRENDESLESALSKIKNPTLMIIDESDLVFTKPQAEKARKMLPNCNNFYYNSKNGHLSCIYESEYFEKAIRNFIAS